MTVTFRALTSRKISSSFLPCTVIHTDFHFAGSKIASQFRSGLLRPRRQTIAPSTPLFTIRLVTDELHTAQRELFKASQEIEIARQRRGRLAGLAQGGGDFQGPDDRNR
jgi:hypothetical protein